MPRPERVLFVHAHPDDETIATGGTIATLVDHGSRVTVLTCTRGERGEVIPEDLQGALASPAALAALRTGELAAAMTILGVTDHRYLGDENARWTGKADRHYVDSGMSWGQRDGKPIAQPAADSDLASLTSADLGDVTSDIVSVVISVGPDAVVSYDENGGYGHPDHIRVHDAARRAADLYGIPFYSVLATGVLPGGVAADSTIAVDIAPVLDRKRRALGAYRSQLTVDGDSFVLSGGQREPIASVERFELLGPEAAGSLPFSDQHPATRFVVSVLAGVIGVIFGGLLTVFNQSTWAIGGANIWIGVILAMPVIAVLLAGFRLAFETRIVAGFAAVGMIVIVGILSLLGIGGSVLIPWNGPGIVWQISPTVVTIAVLVWPRSRRARPGKIVTTSIIATPAEPVPAGAESDAPSKGPQQP